MRGDSPFAREFFPGKQRPEDKPFNRDKEPRVFLACQRPGCQNRFSRAPSYLRMHPSRGRYCCIKCRDLQRTARAKLEQKTHCANGHEYSAANTYINTLGGRQCRKCNGAACKRYRLKRLNIFNRQLAA